MPHPHLILADQHEALEKARDAYNNLRLSKGTREAALRRVREIEAELDLPEAERTPSHNGQPAEQPTGFLPFARRTASFTKGQRLLLIDALSTANNQPDVDPDFRTAREELIAYISSL